MPDKAATDFPVLQERESQCLTRAEFIERFVAEMLRIVGPTDAEGEPVEPYARDTAPSYFEEQYQRDGETPEDCAAADVSYWEPA